MRRTLVVLALLFAVVMSNNEVEDSQVRCEKEAAASVKCLNGCKAKHSDEKEIDDCMNSECNADFEAEMDCLINS
ncbi:unnamed protein product [Nippostrongylus brasiliensis]|uniref:CFEM domain-containing protein n=1 Tax=Nippostrongylus brasiliensis TaxID=27835 RepID=A0A0N4YE50_NIPBR|nr:unnamed protein product [Nippostrongylus brasiliensis]